MIDFPDPLLFDEEVAETFVGFGHLDSGVSFAGEIRVFAVAHHAGRGAAYVVHEHILRHVEGGLPLVTDLEKLLQLR